jgi:hypothetical protein
MGDFMSLTPEKPFPFSLVFELLKQPEVSWSQIRRIQHMIHGSDAFSCLKW